GGQRMVARGFNLVGREFGEKSGREGDGAKKEKQNGAIKRADDIHSLEQIGFGARGSRVTRKKILVTPLGGVKTDPLVLRGRKRATCWSWRGLAAASRSCN